MPDIPLAGRKKHLVGQVRPTYSLCHPLISHAAGTWLAMNEDIVPFHEIPFVRKLSRISVENIVFNLDEGFQNQQEVNEAALMMDDELLDALEEDSEMEWDIPE